MRDRQLQLVRDDRLAHGLPQQIDLPRRVVRNPEGTHLARGLELIERARDLLGLHERVGTVQQQDVDVIRAERGERTVHRLDDVLVREVEVRAVAHDARLRLDRELGALRGRQLHRLCEAALALVQVAPVDVGVIDEVDAGVTGGAHELADLVVGLLGDAHEAEHDVRRDDLGSGQGEGLHGVVPLRSVDQAAWASAESSATSSAVSVSSAASTESWMLSGREAPGIGITTGARESSHARATCWGLMSLYCHVPNLYYHVPNKEAIPRRHRRPRLPGDRAGGRRLRGG